MKTLTLEQLRDITKTGLKNSEVILDVREIEEFAEGHIPGATNFPLSTIESKIDEIKKYTNIYIHCQGGVRAQKAFALLSSKGIQNMTCVTNGGFGNWKAAGYPVEK